MSAIGSGARKFAPLTPKTPGSKFAPLISQPGQGGSSNPNTAVDPSLRHAELFQRPKVEEKGHSTYVPLRNYIRDVIPNVSKNPADFGGSRFKTSLVENRLRAQERNKIHSQRKQMGYKPAEKGERLGIHYLTGLKNRPNTPAGKISTVTIKTEPARLDFAGLNNIPTKYLDIPGFTQSGGTMIPPGMDNPVSITPATISENETASAAEVYRVVETGAGMNVPEPVDKHGKTIMVVAMVALVVFLVLKGRI